MGIRTAYLIIFSLLFSNSLAFSAAIQGKEEGSVVGYCKSIDFVGGSQTLTASGLDCTLTSTAGDVGGDVGGVGDCTGGDCLDGTSDGGTWLKFYDAQGAGQLITGDLTGARVWTFPDETGTVVIGEINEEDINWPDLINGLLGSAGINWVDIETLKSVKSSGINWQNLEEISKSDINWATIQNLTVDSIGEITVDATTGQFRYHDGTAQRVVTKDTRKCFGWFSPADADDNIEVWTFKYASTVTNISCRVSGGTSIAVVGGDGTNSFESITCDADGATDDGSITNATFTAGEVLELDLGAPSGTVPSFIYCIDFTTDAD